MLHIMNQEKRKRNEGRVKQRVGNIMDKGSNEARRQRGRGRRGEKGGGGERKEGGEEEGRESVL